MVKRRSPGEGSVHQLESSGHWRAQLRLPGGRRVGKVFATRTEAQQWLTKARTLAASGAPVAAQRITVAAFLDRWLADVVAMRCRPRTIESYQTVVRLHLKPALGEIKLPALRGDQVQRLLAEKTASGLSARSVQYIHSVLHRALKHAVRWGLVVRNVAELADSPRVQRRPMKTLTAAQVRTFLDATRGDRLHALYVMAVTTGMRQGELLGLRWSDIDLDRRRVQITTALQSVTGQAPVLAEPKSDHSRRLIILSPAAVTALRQHRPRQLEERLLAGDQWHDQDLVFCTSVGTPLSRHNIVSRYLHPALDKAGLPRIRFHDLRHTAATLLLEQGIHPKVVQEMLGHSQISLTLDTYSHVLPGMLEGAADTMQRVLDS